MKSVLVGLVLAAVLCAVSADTVCIFARLSGKNNVNNLGQIQDTGSTATGIFFGFYDTTSKLINYYVVHNVLNVTQAHIHAPANTTQNAAVILDTGSAVGQTWYQGTWNNTVNAAVDQPNLFNNLAYFNVHSPQFPAGEIRGQISTTGVTHVALLDFDSQNVAANPAPLQKGIAMLTMNYTSQFLGTVVNHQVTNPTAAHIHGNATYCNNAGIVKGYTNPANEIVENFQYVTKEVQDMDAQLQYVNIHTTAFPNGIIRGQIVPLTFYNGNPGRNNFRLSGCGANTPTPTPTATTNANATTTATPGTTGAPGPVTTSGPVTAGPTPTPTKSSASVIAASMMTIVLMAIALL